MLLSVWIIVVRSFANRCSNGVSVRKDRNPASIPRNAKKDSQLDSDILEPWLEVLPWHKGLALKIDVPTATTHGAQNLPAHHISALVFDRLDLEKA